MMEAQEIIKFIADAKRVTPVKVYLRETGNIDFSGTNAKVFGNDTRIIFGDWSELGPILENNKDKIADIVIENAARNSAIPLLDMKDIPARIEPGAIIRDNVSIGKNAVIMMGAVINIGAVIGEGTMIDMNAVLAGVIEPASARPVIIEDNVLIGANAVVIEGVHVGENSVIAAGAVVIEDVPAGKVVAGCPARIIKDKDENTTLKTALELSLRKI